MMKIKRTLFRLGTRTGVVALVAFVLLMSILPLHSRGRADNLRNAPPFDFSDDFYTRVQALACRFETAA